MNKASKTTQYYIVLTSYISLSFAIFTPMFNSRNLPIRLFFCFLSAFIYAIAISFLFSKNVHAKNTNGIFAKILSVIAALESVFCVLLLMTEVIKDTSRIAGRGVNKEYYLLLSLFILAVCLYLCFNSEKGIYRFCCISVLPLILFAVSCLLAHFTVREITADFIDFSAHFFVDDAVKGIFSGLFLSADISIFLYCFHSIACDRRHSTKLCLLSLITAFGFWCLCIISVYTAFGKNLIILLSDPFYALTKAFDGFDTTEILSAVRIFAFVIKSSVYIYSASLALKRAFFCQKACALKVIIPVLFLAVPAIYRPFLLFSKSSYGSLQHLIYISVITLSFCFIILLFFRKKQN